MTIAKAAPALTDEVTLHELVNHDSDNIKKATSRFIDILLTTIQREENPQDEELVALEFELFKLSRSIPVDLRRAAWEYKREQS